MVISGSVRLPNKHWLHAVLELKTLDSHDTVSTRILEQKIQKASWNATV